MHQNARRAAWMAALLIALTGGYSVGRLSPQEEGSVRAAPAGKPAPTSTSPAGDGARSGVSAESNLSPPDFRGVARMVIPAVVTVRSQKTVRASASLTPFGDELFEQFFGGPRRGRSRDQRYVQRGLGSGVILSADGRVITNNHVVEGVDKVEVITSEGQRYAAKVLGSDPQTDIALLKVEATGLTPIAIGDSDALDVGEWVLAVGNPFSEQLGHTVTAGIVSAKGRSNLHLADYEDFIQTDAAINPGNSGGALVNTAGQLVGINAAIVSGGGGNNGIGFAIPIDMIKNVMEQLVKEGHVVRGYMGVSIQDLTPELAEGLGVKESGGAVVAEVQSGGPADRGGLHRGDIILDINGEKVVGSSDLRNRVAGTPPSTKVTFGVLRDGKEKKVDVVLGEAPGAEIRPGHGSGPMEESVGLTVHPLTRDLAARLGYEGETGVIVAEVEQGSPADDAGIQEGDLIKEINRNPVSDVATYRQALASARKGSVIVMLLRRGDSMTYVTLRP